MEKKSESPAKVEEGGNWFAFDFCNRFLQTESSVSAAVADLLERLRRWNVDYAEVRFCPELHTEAGILTSEEAVKAVLKGDVLFYFVQLIVGAVVGASFVCLIPACCVGD